MVWGATSSLAPPSSCGHPGRVSNESGEPSARVLLLPEGGIGGPVRLTPLSLDDEVRIAHAILRAHSPGAARVRGPSEPFVPMTLNETAQALRRAGIDGVSPFSIAAVADRLCEAQFLHACGYPGPPPLGGAYWSFLTLTAHQKRGDTFLTAALGWRFLLARVRSVVPMIEARNQRGTVTCGSGLHLGGGVVVTNAHVVDDAVPFAVWFGDEKHDVINTVTDPGGADVGLVRVSGDAPRLPDLSVRDPVVTEQVLVLGHPPVPQAQSHTMIVQSGEVCGEAAQKDVPFALVTTIVRPGNSGGPVFGRDGRLVGLVSRSFEREREPDDSAPPFPHFGCVPGSVLRDSVHRIDATIAFPWEDYAQ